MEMTGRIGSRIQRDFVGWYRENASRFTIPLRLIARSRRRLDLAFVGITSVISARLSENELIVSADMDDECFDTIADIEAHPLNTPLGYVCTLCDPSDRTFYRTRKEFWRQHLFERFLAWANEKLAPAHWIRLSSIDGGEATWATLIRDEIELTQQDRTLQLIQSLRRLGGQHVFEGGQEDVTNHLIALKLETL
ncbi:MAG: hypothetical protein Q7T21_13030 [Gallionella sp.]|nr:hypothetical protein [Gallionella sp.]